MDESLSLYLFFKFLSLKAHIIKWISAGAEMGI
jgi:hypothetical protein